MLSGIQIKDEADALQALTAMHSLGVPNVVITSVSLSTPKTDMSTLILYGSSLATSRTDADQFCIKFPKLNGRFTGTGDLTAALILAHCAPTDENKNKSQLKLRNACEKAMATIQAVLKCTVDYAGEETTDATLSPAARVRKSELRLIQSKVNIESPLCSLWKSETLKR